MSALYPKNGEMLTRAWAQNLAGSAVPWNDGEGNWNPPTEQMHKLAEVGRQYLELFDRYGADNTYHLPEEIRAQLPNNGHYMSKSPKTLGSAIHEFSTHPAVLTAAGGVAGVLMAPASAAGAASGGGAGAGGTTAAWEGLGGLGEGVAASGGTAAASTAPAGSFQTASANTGTMTDVAPGLFEQGGAVAGGGETASLGSGITQGAGGTTGLTTGAGGATGITTAGNTSGALSAGFFGSETAAPVLGGASSAAAGSAVQGTTTGPSAPQGDYQFPWKESIGAALQLYSANQQSKTAQQLQQDMMASDQFRPQQPRYFEPLYDAATKGVGETAYGRSIADSAARKSAAMGYNLSPNQTFEIAKGLDAGSMDYVRALTPLATGRGESNSFGAFGQAQLNAQNQTMGAIGYGLQNIFSGQQPTVGQQMNGTPQNKNLYESVYSL